MGNSWCFQVITIFMDRFHTVSYNAVVRLVTCFYQIWFYVRFPEFGRWGKARNLKADTIFGRSHPKTTGYLGLKRFPVRLSINKALLKNKPYRPWNFPESKPI